jgi:hypothetical protein
MTDVALQTALARLAPDVDGVPAWDDVVRRAGMSPRIRWKLAAIVAATLLATGIVAGALAEGIVSGSLDRLSSWIGDEPGEPAPEQQASFDEENALSYVHFPPDTHVGRLLAFEFEGRSHELMGFRDGANLCVRIVPPLFDSVSRPECVPTTELARLGDPVAVLGGFPRGFEPGNGGAAKTMAYGLAADNVVSVEALDAGRFLGAVDVHNNAFFMALPNPFHPRSADPAEQPPLLLRARTSEGAIDVPIKHFPFFMLKPQAEDIPGPTHAERTLEAGSVSWLQREEPRGDPYQWPFEFPATVLYSRVVRPDPTSSFRVAIALGEEADWRENGRWYCLAWFWPLVPDSKTSRGCGRVDNVMTGLTLQGTSSGFGEFPHWVGIASDEVARLRIFYESGDTKNVPIVDNLFSFYVDGVQGSKLVAYDAHGQVVRVMRLT